MASSRQNDGCHGVGDRLPPQCTAAGPVVEGPREEEVHKTNNALRRPHPGTRPGVLQDPGLPWVEAVTVSYVAAAGR